jgi:hypothetical protein
VSDYTQFHVASVKPEISRGFLCTKVAIDNSAWPMVREVNKRPSQCAFDGFPNMDIRVRNSWRWWLRRNRAWQRAVLAHANLEDALLVQPVLGASA